MADSIQTHNNIDHRLCGKPLETADGTARVALTTLPEMAVDNHNLVHGGFIFGLADHAAMIAVNHPNVVLGGAEVTFQKPVTVGDQLVAEAISDVTEGKKRPVQVMVMRGDEPVFKGTFTCFVLNRHVLEERLSRL